MTWRKLKTVANTKVYIMKNERVNKDITHNRCMHTKKKTR